MLPAVARQLAGNTACLLQLQQLRAGLSIKGLAASGVQWNPSAFLASGVDSADTHDDFKPKQMKPAGPDQEPNYQQVKSEIEKDISQHDVFLYMKGIPRAPQCGFSNLAVRVLDAYGVQFGARNVLADPAIREGIKKYTEWPTIPQVFINGQFVGGSDILMSMHESGELEKVLDPIIKKQQQQKPGQAAK